MNLVAFFSGLAVALGYYFYARRKALLERKRLEDVESTEPPPTER